MQATSLLDGFRLMLSRRLRMAGPLLKWTSAAVRLSRLVVSAVVAVVDELPNVLFDLTWQVMSISSSHSTSAFFLGSRGQGGFILAHDSQKPIVAGMAGI